MNPMQDTDVLFYPFHLCHEQTLRQLLSRYARVHFRDYMAIQLSPLFGTTAYPDRMGDAFPGLGVVGRLVQGYDVSGPLSLQVCAAIDCDLSDQDWRDQFHIAMANDVRFQRGLCGTPANESTAGWMTDETWRTHPYTVASLRERSQIPLSGPSAESFDYGFALLKTSAALVYTVQLATEHDLAVATDSPAHFALLAHSTKREGIRLPNSLITRNGY